jgi:tripartite-type tricarboxylate transporter receptor subunit TctC
MIRRMNMKVKGMCLRGIVVLTIMFTLVSLSWAGEFPTKRMEWLAPWGITTSSGLAARIIADNINKSGIFPKQIILVPTQGAGGVLAGEQVAKRVEPDGHTLLLANSATNVIALHTKKDIKYTIDDFEFLALHNAIDMGLLVRGDAPYKTLEEFVEYVKKNPHKIKMAQSGVGTLGHLCLELFKLRGGGLKVDMVPYNTSTEMTTALLGGHCQASFMYGGEGGPTDNFTKTIDGGGRLLAVATEERQKAYPEVPTLKEKGLDVVISGWYGIAGPKGMPKVVSQKLKNAIYKAIEDPEVNKALKTLGLRYIFLKSEEFTSFVKEYDKLIRTIVEEAKIPKR